MTGESSTLFARFELFDRIELICCLTAGEARPTRIEFKPLAVSRMQKSEIKSQLSRVVKVNWNESMMMMSKLPDYIFISLFTWLFYVSTLLIENLQLVLCIYLHWLALITLTTALTFSQRLQITSTLSSLRKKVEQLVALAEDFNSTIKKISVSVLICTSWCEIEFTE